MPEQLSEEQPQLNEERRPRRGRRIHRLHPPPPGYRYLNMCWKVSTEEFLFIDGAAQKYDVSVNYLVREVMRKIIQDNMLDAVLDGPVERKDWGHRYPTRKPKKHPILQTGIVT